VAHLLATRQLLLVHVSRAADIRQVLRLARDYRLNVALVGAQEGWVVADEIAAARVPVIINPTDNLPRRFEMAAASDRNAALLHRAGVRIAILGTDRTHRVHEMRYNAGIAVGRGGLAYDAALAALTSGPATLLGLGDRLGTLEPGKDADIVVWSGDPLQPASRPRAIFIGGREQSLASRGTALRDRYLPRAAPEPAQP
jgi:imidazolonepropionase-like amidohydrolase